MRNLFFFLFLITGLICKAQESGTITGVVSDGKGATLPGATIFLTNTKHITSSDTNGRFILKNLEGGTYELVIKMIGFKAYVNKITVGDKPENINVVLTDDNVLLNEVKITAADPNRDKYIALFTKYFIGESTNAGQCKITNPEVLRFHYNKKAGLLEASTEQMLRIENRGLGYRLQYLVTDFKFDKNNLTLTYTGYPYFEELSGTEKQQKRWEINRKTAYAGSASHFFRAAFNNTAEAAGFSVYVLSDKAARMKLSQVPPTPAGTLFSPAENNYKLLKADYSQLTAADTTALYIFYKGGAEPYNYVTSGLSIPSPIKLPGRGQLSKLEPLTPAIMIDKNGGVNPQQGFLTSGYWAWTKVSELMPMDYHLNESAATATNPTLTQADDKVNEMVTNFNTRAAANPPAEKIYLQLNKPWYSRADTIWFKAYVVSGNKHRLSDYSQVAYAELISPKDSIIQKLNLRLQSGMAGGDFALPLTLPPGTYRIRAYTNWMKNEGEQNFYDRQIQIGNPVSAALLRIGTNKKDVKISTLTLAKPNTIPDIQLFPEGGVLVNGLRNVVAFKATNPDGSGAGFTGMVVNANGEQFAGLSSGYNGMGSFAFTPTEGDNYIAKIQFSNGAVQNIDLPKAVAEGYTLTVNNQQTDTLLVKLAANARLFKSKAGTGFYLVAQSGGTVYYTTSGKLDETVYSIKIPKNRFPSGIARLTLFSAEGEPLNERVVFIQRPDQLQLKASTLKNTYAEGEKISVDLRAGTFNNQPVIGSFSVAVINESKVPADEQAEPTIFSQLLLSSEIHGNISTPGYYLANQNQQTVADLDLLMLTQGYRKLDWKQLVDTAKKTPAYLADEGLQVSGILKGTNGKPVSRGKITLIFPGLKTYLDTLSNAEGRFCFRNIDISETAQAVLKAVTAEGTNKLKIELDKPIQTTAILPTGYTATSPQLTAAYQEEESQYNSAKGRLLKEVTIKEKYDPGKLRADAYAGSTNRNGPGNADQVISGKDLVGCPILIQCIATKFHSLSYDGNESLYDISRGHNAVAGTGPVNFALDGVIIGNISGINSDDIQSIELLTSNKYKVMYGHDAAGGLILLTTKKGIPKYDRLRAERALNMVTYNFNGFYKARSFYTPKYETNSPESEQRPAIYWQPDMVTDQDGKAALQFINAGKGSYRLVVEGIDDEGRLGRLVYRYKVE